ncbi:MAG TPA: response regulator, partial [Verrucomicrobiae bacterium]|nr:response regulator [Verrucomicrobiae bacterium]
MKPSLEILLIDDNPDDRALALHELRREFPDVQVHEVGDGKALTLAMESGDCDLVITDYQLRWTDGLSVLRAIKTHWPDCPIIMFTGTGSEEIAVEAMKAGLDDYVLKASKHYVRLAGAARRALERAAQRRALRESEANYQMLFADVPIGLYKTTPAGRIIDANPAMIQMLGYPDREALLKASAADLYANPAERRRWQQLMERDGVVRHFETQMRRSDETVIWVEDNSHAVRNAEGMVLYYEGSLEDITARLNLETKLLQAQKMESIGHL